MSFYYQSGPGLNLLARAVKAPTLGGTVDSAYPASNLYDGRPSQYTKWTTIAANCPIDFDLNLVQAGDGEAAPDSDWTKYCSAGNSDFVQTATGPYSGTNSLRIYLAGVPSGANYAGAYRDVWVRSGERLRFYNAAYLTTGNNVKFYCQNLESGLWLQSGGTWTASANTAFLTDTTAASWVDSVVTFQVPDEEAGGAHWQRLRLKLECNVTSGTGVEARVQCELVPGWDTVCVLGHTCTVSSPLGFAYQALSGNNPADAFSADTYPSGWLKSVSTNSDPIPVAEWNEQAVWNKLSAIRYERHVRFYASRASVYAPTTALGELLLLQAETMPIQPRAQVTVLRSSPGQEVLLSSGGDRWTYNRTAVPRRKLTLRYGSFTSLAATTDANIRELISYFVDRTHSGKHPVVVIPYEHDSRMVIYGYPSQSIDLSQERNERTFEVAIEEAPIPTIHHALQRE